MRLWRHATWCWFLSTPRAAFRLGAGRESRKARGWVQTRRAKTNSSSRWCGNLIAQYFLSSRKLILCGRTICLPLIQSLTAAHKFAEVIPISARKHDGLEMLVRKIVDVLPTGERYFPKDQYTDQPMRFMVAELIRESILTETGEEVPYAAAVVIERFEEPEPAARRPLTRIAAAIYCERAGQKAILIGKAGSKLKAIGTGARRKIESLLGTQVFLELHVIVEPGWRQSRVFVDSLDWRNQLDRLATDKNGEADSLEKDE